MASWPFPYFQVVATINTTINLSGYRDTYGSLTHNLYLIWDYSSPNIATGLYFKEVGKALPQWYLWLSDSFYCERVAAKGMGKL